MDEIPDLIGTRQQIADWLGISLKRFRTLQKKGIIPTAERGQLSLKISVKSYLDHAISLMDRRDRLNKVNGQSLDPTLERTMLNKARREGQEIQNRIKLGELAPIEVLQDTLMRVSEACATILDSAPVQVKRRCPHIRERDRMIIESIIAKARNQIADIKIELPFSPAMED